MSDKFDDMFLDEDNTADYEIPEDPSENEEAIVPETTTRARQPLFQALFVQSVASNDSTLQDFAHYVVGSLSVHFALKAAKGGAFFRQKEAEGAEKTERYQRDQTLRAHLINGMLPALHIARWLKEWQAPRLRDWDDTTERLFIAGYMLHDFTKIQAVKDRLRIENFAEGEAPSQRQIPTLESIFREWCSILGLDRFLQPVGGVETLLHDLIYVACNTQQLWGTATAPTLLPHTTTDIDVYTLAATVSRLADLLAYVAPTPRDMVAHSTIHKIITVDLGENRKAPGKPVAKLVYHHVAENRGILLNLIHNAAIEALTIENQRVPLLYAPSGVVYLERYDAPPMPSPNELTQKIVAGIRNTAGRKTAETRTGYEVSKDGWRVNDTYRDLFNLREFVQMSANLIMRVAGNPVQYMDFLRDSGWPHTDDMPSYSTDKTDPRLRQLAEWASLIEIRFEEQLAEYLPKFVNTVLTTWGIEDLAEQFKELGDYKQRGVGVRHRWYWAANYALYRRPKDPAAVIERIGESVQRVLAILPDQLPENAQVNPETWQDLEHYIQRVFTMGGVKVTYGTWQQELTHYTDAKSKGGEAACAICGSAYVTREQMTSAVAFQPGVYTGRVKLAFRENKRSMCSICALEQLLSQLFINNLRTGSDAEDEQVRYLSFYPSYFFTPETLKLIKQAYTRIRDMRLSDNNLLGTLRSANDLTDANFWQNLQAFFSSIEMGSSSEKVQRILKFDEQAQATFFTIGIRHPKRDQKKVSETESWVLPALLALVFSVCLDVKVIASDSSVPLLLESSELPETVWFDGAHAAIRALIGDGRLNIDEIGKTLARLTAAYLIHLDTECDKPGRGKGDEHWNRFGPIAHALMESPLYVFHYLKKQERDDRYVKADQVRRYVRYAETLFNDRGDVLMSYAKELVDLYRGFYRAKTLKNANSILRPISVVADALLAADPRLFTDADSLVELAYGELYRFMDRVGKGLADGRFPKGVSVPEREQAMRKFCQKFVNDIFVGVFNKDVAALRGKQLNLLRSACEVLYRDAQSKEWETRGREDDETDDEADEA